MARLRPQEVKRKGSLWLFLIMIGNLMMSFTFGIVVSDRIHYFVKKVISSFSNR